MRIGIFALLCFLSISICSPQLSAQDDSLKHPKPKLLLGLSIPHIFLKGWKLDVITPLAPKFHMYLSPEYYLGQQEYQESAEVSGYGLHGGGRFIFWDEMNGKIRNMAFVHLSLGYNHFRIDTRDLVWVEKDFNNQKVLVQETAPVFKEYNRVSYDYLLGMIWKKQSGFYTEWNFGISVRRVKRKFSENYTPSYLNDEFTWSYGRAGVLPTMGFRVGFMLD